MQSDEPDSEAGLEELSETTVAVLYFCGAFFALAALTVLYKLVRSTFRRPASGGGNRQTKVIQPKQDRQTVVTPVSAASSKCAPSPDPSLTLAAAQASNKHFWYRISKPAPGKPGVSLKSLVKQSRQPAQDVSVDHPLYLNSLKGFTDSVTGVSFSPCGGFIAVACEDRALRVFFIDDVTSRTFTVRKKSLTRDPVDVAFGSTADLFVLTKGGLESAVLEKLTFSPDAKGEALQQEWEVKEVHSKQNGLGLQGGLTAGGHSLAMSFSDATDLQVYTSSGAQLAGLNSSGLRNHGAGMSRDGRFLGAATFTADVRLHEIQYGREGDFRGVPKVMNLKKAHNGPIYALSFSHAGDKVVTSSKDGSWAVWNLAVRYQQDEDPKVLLKRAQETGRERYRLLAFGPNSVIAAAFGTTLHFLDGAHTGNVLEVVENAHDAQITALEWSPAPVKLGSKQTSILASSSLDRRVRLWRAPRL